LLDGLTGAFTGDVYNEPKLKDSLGGTSQNYMLNTTFVVKTHRLASKIDVN